MIKASGRNAHGVPVLFLGLSGENVTRLTAGEPILVTNQAMQELGLPAINVVIHYGRTEQDIADELTAHGVPMREAE